MKSPLLTIVEVSRRLAVGQSTVRGLISTGKLTAAKVGGSWRIDEADLEAFIVAQKTTPGQVPRSVFDADRQFGDVPEEFRL